MKRFTYNHMATIIVIAWFTIVTVIALIVT
jgi:hypothetical protein